MAGEQPGAETARSVLGALLASPVRSGGAQVPDSHPAPAKDYAAALGGAAHLAFSLNQTTGANGDKLQLTITVNTAGTHNNELFYLKSTLGGRSNLWFGLVGN